MKLKRDGMMLEQTNPVIEALREWGNNIFLVGLIEGEGCISLRYRDHNFWARIDVSSTCLSMLEWIWENYGGKIYPRKVYGNRKPSWS